MRFLLLALTLFSLQAFSRDDLNATKPGVYMGRQIAYTMHAVHAKWLMRNSREKEESVKEMIANLGLKKGMTVADVGCGNGYHSLMMAKLIGNTGTVLCVDVQQKMLDLLKERAEEQKVKNYKLILGEYEDPKLPEAKVDLILIVDAYHEFTKPAEMLAKMRKSLSKDGLMVLLEFRAEDKTVPIKPDHKMSKKQILKEMTANGFALAKSYDKLPWQHMMFFKKAEKK